MALDQEDLDKIRDLVTGVVDDKLKSHGNNDGDPKNNNDDDDIIAKAQKAAAEDAANKARESAIANSVKFNGMVHSFVKENAEAFGGVIGEKLMEILTNNTKNENEVDRANEFRKNLIDQFIQLQANIDNLPDGSKAEIEHYRGLTEADKRAQSAKYWTVIESGLEINKQMKKAKQIAIANSAGSSSNREIPKHIMVPTKKAQE